MGRKKVPEMKRGLDLGRKIEPQGGLAHLQGVAAGQGRFAGEGLIVQPRAVFALQILRPPLPAFLPDAGVDARDGRVRGQVNLHRRASVGAADDDVRPLGGFDPPLALILKVYLHRVSKLGREAKLATIPTRQKNW